ncbi:DNA internalization-related competence protein ComEC/Rec2 [Ligilactobacillus saerimneri]|uniref:DNA internalization-related competence protein ComEC/Rec2 n=2 Tax=Ligilactobacillus saerimneri TaxID=228229 RepID=UPI0022A6C24D|nr:DNA internalization-related competence protein ComEC/Rec2 [Ligilactobacillus saerimneri]MCZ0891878.1 DNA internalization-related competence protein ComEC/Rec2 [Ligilactobacillus saerimneri]
MRQQLVFYLALATVCLSLLVTSSHKLLFALVWVLLTLRIIWAQQKSWLIVWLIWNITATAWLNWRSHDLNLPPGNITHAQFQVYADDVEVDGDRVALVGTLVEQEKLPKVRGQAYYYCHDQREQAFYCQNKHNLVLTIAGQVRPVSGPTNENQFDYRHYLASKRLAGVLTIKQIRRVAVARGTPVGMVHHWRQQWRLYLEKLPYYLKWYSKALLLGINETAEPLYTDIQRLGLIYLFCLSGMHVFYLVTLVQKCGQYLHISRETSNWILLGILPVFLIIAGQSPSLIRAVLMVELTIFLRDILHYPVHSLTIWAVVLSGNLLWSPFQVQMLGFELSYLLTMVLLLSQEISSLRLGVRLNLVSFPLLVWHTFQWNWLTIPLSLVVMPVFQVLILPSTIVGSIWPGGFNGCEEILKGISAVWESMAKWPTTITYGKPALITVIGMISMLLYHQVAVRKKIVKILLMSMLLLNYGIIHFPLSDEVVYFDIGQGDATLLRQRFNRQVVLIDTGGQVSFNRERWRRRVTGRTNGETIIANYLLSQGIDHLDGLLLTHQDTDHTGNMPSIMWRIAVREIYVPWGMEHNQHFRNKIQEPTTIHPVVAGSKLPFRGMTVLHPIQEGMGKNEDSMVLVYNWQQRWFFFSGDLDQAGEKAILHQNPDLKIDYLKLGHHGSKTATSIELLRQVEPQIAIISAGRNNRYHHPSEETVTKLNERKIPFMNTAEVGMIKIKKGWHEEIITFSPNEQAEHK